MSDIVKGFVEGLLGTGKLSALEVLGGIAAKVALALIVTVLALIVASRVRDKIVYYLHQSKRDRAIAILLGRIIYFMILFVGVLLVMPLFGLSAAALFATLGVLGLAVSLAMQDVLKNVFAGIYLLIERPFRPGDTIKIRDFVGVVETVDLRTTTLRADGEIVFVPNAILFGEVLVNRGMSHEATDETPE